MLQHQTAIVEQHKAAAVVAPVVAAMAGSLSAMAYQQLPTDNCQLAISNFPIAPNSDCTLVVVLLAGTYATVFLHFVVLLLLINLVSFSCCFWYCYLQWIMPILPLLVLLPIMRILLPLHTVRQAAAPTIATALSSTPCATFIIVVCCRKGSAKEDTKLFLNYATQRWSRG